MAVKYHDNDHIRGQMNNVAAIKKAGHYFLLVDTDAARFACLTNDWRQQGRVVVLDDVFKAA